MLLCFKAVAASLDEYVNHIMMQRGSLIKQNKIQNEEKRREKKRILFVLFTRWRQLALGRNYKVFEIAQ